MNEGEFDLFRYRFRKKMLATAYVPANHWQIIGHEPLPFENKRKLLLDRVANAFYDEEQADVAKALVFGYEEDIDEETKSAFQQSGIIHILAVSGMHVSIIWILLSRFLFFLNASFSQRLAQTCIVLACLWTYAAITGFSPSILRATVMFSFLSWAKLRNKGKNTWNMLCVSAFFILLLSPSFLFDAGFWLSYLAVIGIMTAAPLWQLKLESYPQWKKWIFELFAITIVAQSFTMFYAMFMFGTFPNWFLLNNVIAVPLSSIALLEGLTYIALADLPLLSDLLAALFRLLIKWMVDSAYFFKKLPYAYSEHIHFSLSQLILAYVGIAALFYALHKRKKRFLPYTFYALILIFCMHFVKVFYHAKWNGLVWYALRNESYVEWVENGEVLEILNGGVGDFSRSFYINAFKRKNYLPRKTYKLPPFHILQTTHGSLLLADPNPYFQFPDFYTDCWSIAGNISPPNYAPNPPRIIILHGNIYASTKRKWENFAQKNEVFIYDVHTQGMLKMKLW